MRILRVLLLATLATTGSSSDLFHQQDNTIYDEDVEFVNAAPMEYPPELLHSGVLGTALIKVSIGEDGGVVGASPVAGNPWLIPRCVSNARKWRFKPNPQKSAIIVYEFRQGDSLCSGGAYSRIREPNLVEVTVCRELVGY